MCNTCQGHLNSSLLVVFPGSRRESRFLILDSWPAIMSLSERCVLIRASLVLENSFALLRRFLLFFCIAKSSSFFSCFFRVHFPLFWHSPRCTSNLHFFYASAEPTAFRSFNRFAYALALRFDRRVGEWVRDRLFFGPGIFQDSNFLRNSM